MTPARAPSSALLVVPLQVSNLLNNHPQPMRENELRLAASCFITRTINRLDAAGWLYEAQCLLDDYERGSRVLPELLMVRDDAERLAAQLEADA